MQYQNDVKGRIVQKNHNQRMAVLQQSSKNTNNIIPDVYNSQGAFVKSYELQERIDQISQGLLGADIIPVSDWAGNAQLLMALHDVHNPAMVAYVQNLSEKCPENSAIYAKKYQSEPYSPSRIEATTWDEACGAASIALAAAEKLAKGAVDKIYALIRPPGHHAGRDFFGGYCFFNNAALAAQYLICNFGICPAILDIDYHAADGTINCLAPFRQIAVASLHRSTKEAYPYCNELMPYHSLQKMFGIKGMVQQTDYLNIIDDALNGIISCQPDILIVSIGFDIVEGDPHGGWRLSPEVFFDIAKRLKETGLPLLFIQEGGYRVDVLTECAKQFMHGLG